MNDLLQKIKTKLIQTEQLALDNSELFSEVLVEQFQKNLSKADITLHQNTLTALTETDNYLSFKAYASELAGVFAQPLNLIFFIENEKVECLFKSILPLHWDFSWAYPNMPNFLHLNTPETTSASFFFDLAFNKPVQIIFSSVDFNTHPKAKDYLKLLDTENQLLPEKLQQGLNYISELNLGDDAFPLFAALKQFIPFNKDVFPFYSYYNSALQELELKIELPAIHLFENPLHDIFHVRLSDLIFFANTNSYDFSAKSGIYFLGSIHFGKSTNQGNNIRLLWPLGSKRLIIKNEKEIKLDQFSVFNKLLKKEHWQESFPFELEKVNSFIRELSIDLVFPNIQDSVITLALGPPDTWTYSLLSGNALMIDDIVLKWIITPKKSSFNIFTAFEIEGGQVYGSAAFPDFVFSAELGLHQQISLDQLVKEFFPHAPLPKLRISDLELNLDLIKNHYYFDIDFASDWSITPQTGSPFPLQELNLQIEKEAGSTFLILKSVWKIADANIYLLALNTGQANAGWNFSGTSKPGKFIPIGKILEDFARLFHVDQLFPKTLEGLELDNLSVSFNTKNKTFHFSGEASLWIGELNAIDLILNIDIKKENGQYYKEFSGHLSIENLIFDIEFLKDPQHTFFVASYQNEHSKGIHLKNILSKLSRPIGNLLPGNFELEIKNVFLFIDKPGSDADLHFMFGLDIEFDFSLLELPLAGKLLSKEEVPKIKAIQIAVSNQDMNHTDTNNIINTLLETNSLHNDIIGNYLQGKIFKANKPEIRSTFNMGRQDYFLGLPLDTASSNESTYHPAEGQLPLDAKELQAIPAATKSFDRTKWFALHRQVGPIYFERIGLEYQNGKLWFLFEATILTNALKIAFLKLGMGSSLQKFRPEFKLSGLGLDYQNDYIEIGGTFYRQLTNRREEYDGQAIIKTIDLQLSALGVYGKYNDQHALFLYGILDKPIGGPPYFFVTGLAGGFGYNRQIKIPGLKELPDFPLITEAIHPTSTPVNINTTLEKLGAVIPVVQDKEFLTAGVKFTTFNLIDSFALLTLALGHRLTINILGISDLVIPANVAGEPSTTPLAKVELAYIARVLLKEGLFKVKGQLTKASFLFSRACRLNGGFAMSAWASGQYAGDFVYTMGGYHPAFQIPQHYPKANRLSFNWNVDSHIHINGQAYFALTPHAFMAGGHLQAIWQRGDLKAWFNTSADFIICWKPYHYSAKMHVSFGVSYTFSVKAWFVYIRKTISVDIGVDLSIWGPEFGGKAHIHLWIVSFDITFGKRGIQNPPPITDWNIFQKSFLPNQHICTIHIESGLIRKLADGSWVINPKDFRIITNSLIPSTTVAPNISLGNINKDIGIVPMEKIIEESVFTLKINDEIPDLNESPYSLIPIKKNVPAALWGTTFKRRNSSNLNKDLMVNGVLTGLKIQPKKHLKAEPVLSLQLDRAQYQEDEHPSVGTWEKRSIITLESQPNLSMISDSILESSVIEKRNDLIAKLNLHFASDDQINIRPNLVESLRECPQILV